MSPAAALLSAVDRHCRGSIVANQGSPEVAAIYHANLRGSLSKKRVRSISRPFRIHDHDALIDLLIGHVQSEFAT